MNMVVAAARHCRSKSRPVFLLFFAVIEWICQYAWSTHELNGSNWRLLFAGHESTSSSDVDQLPSPKCVCVQHPPLQELRSPNLVFVEFPRAQLEAQPYYLSSSVVVVQSTSSIPSPYYVSPSHPWISWVRLPPLSVVHFAASLWNGIKPSTSTGVRLGSAWNLLRVVRWFREATPYVNMRRIKRQEGKARENREAPQKVLNRLE